MKKERVVIIGSGASGLTAALYTGRAALDPVVIVGNELGGQVAITSEIENYPGFPDGLEGPELVELMKKQAERFGARLVYDEVVSVDFTHGSPFTVNTHNESYLADAVIVTSGAAPRRLQVAGENENIGRGVSFCATCDGFFFRGKEVVVVGGGDSALEEALFLTKFVSRIRIIHRRDTLRAGVALRTRAMANPKISFVWNSAVTEIMGDQLVQQVRIKNLLTNEEEILDTDGVFIYIGHIPNSQFLQDQLVLDEQGYVIADELMRTSVPGIFAAGEIQDPIYRQVATSVGQGCAAAMQCEKWLAEHEAEPTAAATAD